jgi:hypothetical protein
MTIEDITKALTDERRHICAKCLATIRAGRICQRAGSATAMQAVCHGRGMSQVVPDSTIEDGGKVWWFLDCEGTPTETRAERRRRLLAEELERHLAARGER